MVRVWAGLVLLLTALLVVWFVAAMSGSSFWSVLWEAREMASVVLRLLLVVAAFAYVVNALITGRWAL